MRITILDDYQDAVRKLDCFQLLEGKEVKIFNNTVKGLGQLAVRLRDAEALVLIRERTAISKQLLDKLPNLKLISQTGGGASHIDLASCTERGIPVLIGAGSPIAPAELTWALIMAATRRIPQYAANLKQGAWQQSGLKASTMPANFSLGRNLHGKTLGLFGYGKIAQHIARYAQAFDMNITVWGRPSTLQRAKEAGINTSIDQATFFSECDIISIHLRLNEETDGIIGIDDLTKMKKESLLINTSRSELIAKDALVLALNRGRPGMAAVDVFESEPTLQGHPLIRMENVIATPHLGYVEQDSYELYFGDAFRNILAWLDKKEVKLANPEVLNVNRRAI